MSIFYLFWYSRAHAAATHSCRSDYDMSSQRIFIVNLLTIFKPQGFRDLLYQMHSSLKWELNTRSNQIHLFCFNCPVAKEYSFRTKYILNEWIKSSCQTTKESSLPWFFINSLWLNSLISSEKPTSWFLSYSCNGYFWSNLNDSPKQPWFIFKKSRRENAKTRTPTDMRMRKCEMRNMLRRSSWMPIIVIYRFTIYGYNVLYCVITNLIFSKNG